MAATKFPQIGQTFSRFQWTGKIVKVEDSKIMRNTQNVTIVDERTGGEVTFRVRSGSQR